MNCLVLYTCYLCHELLVALPIWLVDLRKAFDTVDHSLLCGKLEKYGVRNDELHWFVSYLAGRKQFCRVHETDSQVNALTLEYLKARVLLLSYSLPISMIPKFIECCTVTVYADDTGLFLCGACLAHLNETLNKDLESLDNWLKGSKLSLNLVKAESMNILSRQEHQMILGKLYLKVRDKIVFRLTGI